MYRARGSAVIKVMRVNPRPGHFLKTYVDPYKLPRKPKPLGWQKNPAIAHEMPHLDVSNFEKIKFNPTVFCYTIVSYREHTAPTEKHLMLNIIFYRIGTSIHKNLVLISEIYVRTLITSFTKFFEGNNLHNFYNQPNF